MNFTAALDRKVEDIQRPPNPPIGHYIWQIVKHPENDEFDSRAGDHYDRITFQCAVVAPSDDIDSDELAEYGKIEGYRSRVTFMFKDGDEDPAAFERSMFNLRRFLENCGIDPDLTVGEALAASVNCQFLGELKHRPNPEDAEQVFAEIGTTASVG